MRRDVRARAECGAGDEPRPQATAFERGQVVARIVRKRRRDFLVSAMGAASTLLAFNSAYAAFGRTGGAYELEQEAAFDPALALKRLGQREFIFDVQGHFVGKSWQSRHPLGGADRFVKDVFLDSDTDMMVLSFIPSTRRDEILAGFRGGLYAYDFVIDIGAFRDLHRHRRCQKFRQPVVPRPNNPGLTDQFALLVGGTRIAE